MQKLFKSVNVCKGCCTKFTSTFFTAASASRMRVIYHNWSAMKQRPHPQSVAEISHHSVLSGGRIRQCETSSGSRHKDTDQYLLNLLISIDILACHNVCVICYELVRKQDLYRDSWMSSVRFMNQLKMLIIIIVFIEIKLTIATCYNDTSNKLPRWTALHCIIEHKALARRPSSQPNITQVLARSVRLLLSARCPRCRNLISMNWNNERCTHILT